MRHLDLFSGIGGFSLGLEATGGFQTVGFVEWEKFPQQVLRKHWPHVPIMGDIREVKGNEFGNIDIITGGFPCQPFSCAGKRGGKGDDRYLWPEMCRLIDATKPRWVIGENVPGIIRMALDDVLSDLEAIGYTGWPVVIPACAVGARHRRNRVWIVANPDCEWKPQQERGKQDELRRADNCATPEKSIPNLACARLQEFVSAQQSRGGGRI